MESGGVLELGARFRRRPGKNGRRISHRQVRRDKNVRCVVVLSAALFLLPDVPPAGTAAVFLFNMTMPVTLWAMARLFPGAKGFSFGLLTFGLFLGFVPVYLGCPQILAAGEGLTLAAIVSLVLLLSGLGFERLVGGRLAGRGGTVMALRLLMSLGISLGLTLALNVYALIARKRGKDLDLSAS